MPIHEFDIKDKISRLGLWAPAAIGDDRLAVATSVIHAPDYDKVELDAMGIPLDESPARLTFFWTHLRSGEPLKEEVYQELPFPSSPKLVEYMMSAWLDNCVWPPEPQHDGSNGRGFRLFNENYGHVNDHWQAFVAIEPYWLIYGK